MVYSTFVHDVIIYDFLTQKHSLSLQNILVEITTNINAFNVNYAINSWKKCKATDNETVNNNGVTVKTIQKHELISNHPKPNMSTGGR